MPLICAQRKIQEGSKKISLLPVETVVSHHVSLKHSVFTGYHRVIKVREEKAIGAKSGRRSQNIYEDP